MNLKYDFNGKCAIITGAASGIGKATACLLADPEEQARVIAFMLSDGASYLNGACVDSNGGSVML